MKARDTNYRKYGKAFYSVMGAKGGKATGMKGFALNPELARRAGAIGGKVSRRGRVAKTTGWDDKSKESIDRLSKRTEKTKESVV